MHIVLLLPFSFENPGTRGTCYSRAKKKEGTKEKKKKKEREKEKTAIVGERKRDAAVREFRDKKGAVLAWKKREPPLTRLKYKCRVSNNRVLFYGARPRTSGGLAKNFNLRSWIMGQI